MSILLTTEVKYLKGVGPYRAAKLAERGIETVEDLLYHVPFRYEDRLHFRQIRQLEPGQIATVRAKVVSGGALQFGKSHWANRSAMYHLAVEDETGMLHCRFFHGGYLEGKLKPKQEIVLHGKVDQDPYRPVRLEMVNPEFEVLSAGSEDSTEVGRIVPIYEAVGGMSSRMLRRVIHAALGRLTEHSPDPLPKSIRERMEYPGRREALQMVHFPAQRESLEGLNTFRSRAHKRLIFEEFFYYQLGLAIRRQQTQHEKGIGFRVREERIREAVKRILPFKPTDAQKRVLAEIAADMERSVPMSRLLQGDVGSGKTIVALEAATIAIENGYQVALMAPTEILAVQHYLSARRVFAGARYETELLVSGLAPAAKRRARERVMTGEAKFVVGTQALIEGEVKFARLGLVIVDEQHRFGVLQRKKMIEKGKRDAMNERNPDVLVMTATPIPRTLSLTLYGDLDVSLLDEMPPGRAPVETRKASEENLKGVWEFVRGEVQRGRQAYVVYPIIEESGLELKAALAEHKTLAKQIFPEFRVDLLHGRMKSAEKERVMEQFRQGVIQVLVSTTVIEVGVDVPNATVMVIEHAERFGLAQLHQLRGRIGRGPAKSYCILVAPKKITAEAQIRLDTMVRTTNGFEIAETDLELRGPGEFFGTRQHGEPGLNIAQPLRDQELLQLARREAFGMVESGQSAGEMQNLLEYMGLRWQRRYALATVG